MTEGPRTFPTGSIQTPSSGEAVAPGPLRVAGWALDADGPLRSALVVVDDRVATGAHLGWPREDIAAEHPEAPESGRAGWEAKADLRAATGATATISLLAPSQGGWTELDRIEVRLEPGALGSGRRERAVFTIVQNERTFLPIWLRHYGGHFDPADIYVLDHDSTDGSTEGLDHSCRVVQVHRSKSFDHTWLRATVEEFQSFLLCSYRSVLFAEIDELILADPLRYEGGLSEYIERLEGPAACCTGYNVVHYPDEEPPLRFDRRLLAQRGSWHPSELYSKRLLGRVPLRWSSGFHKEVNVPAATPDPELYLVHLHRVDYGYCLERHRAAASRDWSEVDLRDDLGPQSRVVDPEAFREWFFHGEDLDGGREPIPERLRGAL